MWKILSDDVLSELQNGKHIKFQSEETFLSFVEELGHKTGLFIEENIYNKNLILAFNVFESVCKEKGYNYNSIELNWEYRIINNNASTEDLIVY